MGLYNGNLGNYYAGLEDTGSYQFISVTDIINNFRVAYVGEDKIIPKISRADIKFHALRGIQELSYDTFRSCKTLELEVPPYLQLLLPHDYVEYTKISWIDSNGKCHIINQCKACPKDPLSYRQHKSDTTDFLEGDIDVGDYEVIGHGEDDVLLDRVPVYRDCPGEGPFDGPDCCDTAAGYVYNATNKMCELYGPSSTNTLTGPTIEDSTTWANLQNNNSVNSDNISIHSEDNVYQDNFGRRYGLDPQHANINGCFWINCNRSHPDHGKIYFDSNLAGKTVTIQYISDGLATDDEMIVHKFAEEAMYKHIAHSILNARANTDRGVVATFKKERFAAVRNAKIRLSSIKLEEITQILRGKSKWIKH